MAQSPEQMAQAMIANLKERTGKTLPQWLKIAEASGLDQHGALVKELKSEHGVSHGYANLIAHEHLRSGAAATPDVDLVRAQYAGKKAGLEPIYQALMTAIGEFGEDVEVAPKKAYVSLRRSKQFALIQPSTASRVDVGMRLDGVEPTGRLEASGSFNSMVSHRVRVGSVAEVDRELIGWLRRAYRGC